MKIELNKTYRTRDGRKARVICVDRISLRPIVFLIGENCEEPMVCHKDGGIYHDTETLFDLISEWEDKPIFDRSLLPAWANKAIAMDSTNLWFCYSEVPVMCMGIWRMKRRSCIIPKEYAPKWTGDWKDSLLVFED